MSSYTAAEVKTSRQVADSTIDETGKSYNKTSLYSYPEQTRKIDINIICLVIYSYVTGS